MFNKVVGAGLFAAGFFFGMNFGVLHGAALMKASTLEDELAKKRSLTIRNNPA